MEDTTTAAARVPACEKCHAGSMEPARVGRFHGSIGCIGWIVLLGAVLFTVVLAVALFSLMSEPDSPTRDEAVGGMILTMGPIGLIGIALGGFLLQRRNIWRCPSCGYFFVRA